MFMRVGVNLDYSHLSKVWGMHGFEIRISPGIQLG